MNYSIFDKVKKEHKNIAILLISLQSTEYLTNVFKNRKLFIFNSNLSYESLKNQIQSNSIQFIISESYFISILNILQWECELFNEYLIIDNENPHQIIETKKNKLMNSKLWNYTAINAQDELESGGWINSYNREKFSIKEMEEFSEDVLMKISPYLSSTKKVLEIGCSSGLTMFKVAPLVGEYHAIDLSNVMVDRNRKIAAEIKMDSIKLYNLSADQLYNMKEHNFDLVIMNSVIQCFTGYNYLRKVINDCIELMVDKGVIFIGDVMDLRLKDELNESIHKYKYLHPEAKSKLDNSAEIYYDKNFFNDLKFEMPEIEGVECAPKWHTIENELTKYRYDVLLFIDKKAKKKKELLKIKRQYGILLDNTKMIN